MIAERVRKYLDTTLSNAGVSVLNSAVAYRWMPSNWPTRQTAAFDFSIDDAFVLALAQARGCAVYLADIEGIEAPVRVLAMSDDELERRVQRITGLRLSNVRPWKPEPSAVTQDAQATPQKADEPPSYPCRARTLWFEQRGLRDPLEDRGATPGLPTADIGVFGGRRVSKARF